MGTRLADYLAASKAKDTAADTAFRAAVTADLDARLADDGAALPESPEP